MASERETLGILKEEVARYFPVKEVRVLPEGVAFITARPADMEEDFDRLRRKLKTMGFITSVKEASGDLQVGVVRMPEMNTRSVRVNQLMLFLTLMTTVFSGSLLWGSYNGDLSIINADNILGGAFYFALPLLLILGVHELSHFITARRHGINASLPFFIPSIPPIGTFGAFISIREPLPTRKALLDVGVSGPIGGFLVTIPVLLLGFHLTLQGAVPVGSESGPMMYLGVPLAMQLLGLLFQSSQDLMMHPTLFAGWLGLFVTGINLLPAGQLDGGHIARSVLGDRTKWLGMGTVAVLLILSLSYPGWLIFAALIYFLGIFHPPPLNDITPLDDWRKLIAGLALLLLVLCFMPLPIQG